MQLRFESYELVFMGTGAALAALLFVHLIKKLASAAQTEQTEVLNGVCRRRHEMNFSEQVREA